MRSCFVSYSLQFDEILEKDAVEQPAESFSTTYLPYLLCFETPFAITLGTIRQSGFHSDVILESHELTIAARASSCFFANAQAFSCLAFSNHVFIRMCRCLACLRLMRGFSITL